MEIIREILTDSNVWFLLSHLLLAISLITHIIGIRAAERELRLRQWLMKNEIEEMQKRIYLLEVSDKKESLTFVEKLHEKK